MSPLRGFDLELGLPAEFLRPFSELVAGRRLADGMTFGEPHFFLRPFVVLVEDHTRLGDRSCLPVHFDCNAVPADSGIVLAWGVLELGQIASSTYQFYN